MDRLEISRSFWQFFAVWKSSGPAIAQTFRRCKRGLELLKILRVTSPTRCNNSDNGREFFDFQDFPGQKLFFFGLLFSFSWSLEALQRDLMKLQRDGMFKRSTASENRLSASWERAAITFAVSWALKICD
jgi:hypothetical protein